MEKIFHYIGSKNTEAYNKVQQLRNEYPIALEQAQGTQFKQTEYPHHATLYQNGQPNDVFFIGPTQTNMRFPLVDIAVDPGDIIIVDPSIINKDFTVAESIKRRCQIHRGELEVKGPDETIISFTILHNPSNASACLKKGEKFSVPVVKASPEDAFKVLKGELTPANYAPDTRAHLF
jgi:hypothetical protein